MNKLAILAVCGGLLFGAVSAHAEATCAIDNENIQQYQGQSGKWVKISTEMEINAWSTAFGSTRENLLRFNPDVFNSSNRGERYVFFPYSAAYLEKLAAEGKQATIVQTTSRDFVWPIEQVKGLSSVLGLRWGVLHTGIDIPALNGTPIRAVMEGRVIEEGYNNGYGKVITIEHRNGVITRYAHNSANLVRQGDYVQKGQIIALVGSTGQSTGNHLHFEVRCNDVPMDPLDFLPQNNDLVNLPQGSKNWR
jgi:murein DD-endopeptidase MepM/ murein hydrolase activator NlpD